ncbi:putative gamma-glutamylcyclotransferase CG2811 isoform X1 [Periplaneta americana]|uniref:putative gamma-glutamylcyclotransferase CG2811 isoform X1 n=1 Tax=Periplaneta americana TaxID=6978 RepID=UPI0037E80001
MSFHKVFVYGTLKRGEPNHYWIMDKSKGLSKFVGVAKTVEKYPLIIGTKYNIPFLLDAPGRGHNVVGELYQVDETMLQHLDILEDHPSFYVREIGKVKLTADDTVEDCWIYLIKKFKPEMLAQEHFEDYSSTGAHGLAYRERYLRDKSYDIKQDVFPSA